MFQREIDLPKKHSFFLFGPRGVGKSTLLQTFLPHEQTHIIDLLNFELETQLIQKPGELGQILKALPSSKQWVLIDEIQKIPSLLNEVHRSIEKNSHRFFALTGSSARKLKRGQANLLAGRAFTYQLHPLTIHELSKQFDLQTALSYGTLPKIYHLENNENRKDFLSSYAQTYLKEEILAEGLVRNLPAFRRFLPLAAQENGNIISWSNLASDLGLDSKTIRSYFEILEDTLVGFLLPAYSKSIRKRQKSHPKFYLFDPGVKRALAGELSFELVPRTSEYGLAFEHFFILEIMRLANYKKWECSFAYFATHDIEIDLVIEKFHHPPVFIEIKSSNKIKGSMLSPLISIVREIKGAKGFCLCQEKTRRKVENILVLPWQETRSALEEVFGV